MNRENIENLLHHCDIMRDSILRKEMELQEMKAKVIIKITLAKSKEINNTFCIVNLFKNIRETSISEKDYRYRINKMIAENFQCTDLMIVPDRCYYLEFNCDCLIPVRFNVSGGS
jgi:hypothetical protein